MKIKLTNSQHTPHPEGEYVFKINDVNYDETSGKITVFMQDNIGVPHTERFNLMKYDGSINSSALAAFSHFAKIALKNKAITEIEPHDLIGCYIAGRIVHNTVASTVDIGSYVTFANLAEKWEVNEDEE